MKAVSIAGPSAPIFSNYKVATDPDRVEAYLAGRPIYPLTIEMDLDTLCTRACTECPNRNGGDRRFLSYGFLDRLFGILEGQTRGLILTGGEPTVAETFHQALPLARRRGFKEIGVVSNGTRLDDPSVMDTLLQCADVVRISLYDWWEGGPEEGAAPVLERIAALRRRIDREKSQLEIGVAMLTSRERIPRLISTARSVASSGAHWLYLHPYCEPWEKRPRRVDQTGVLETFGNLDLDIEVQTPEGRYSNVPLEFTAFHSAHFLLVLCADGANYISPESKYRQEYVIARLDENMRDDFLWNPERLAAIGTSTHKDFETMGTRHRGPIFSDTIERMINGDLDRQQVYQTASSCRYPFMI